MLIATGSISLMMQSSSVSLLQSDSWMVVPVRIPNDDGCTEIKAVLQKHASYRWAADAHVLFVQHFSMAVFGLSRVMFSLRRLKILASETLWRLYVAAPADEQPRATVIYCNCDNFTTFYFICICIFSPLFLLVLTCVFIYERMYFCILTGP